MGRADQAAGSASDHSKQLSAAALGFPSPVNEDAWIYTPSPSTLADDLAAPNPWSSAPQLSELSAPISAEPREVQLRPMASPMLEFARPLGMDAIVGGTLAPVHENLLSPSASKVAPGLRLPSFEMLGIAAPHPDRFGRSLSDSATTPMASNGMVPNSHSCAFAAMDPLHRFSSSCLVAASCDDNQSFTWPPMHPKTFTSPFHNYVATLTPPAEGGALNWKTIATVTNAPMDSPQTDTGSGTTASEGSRTPSAAPGRGAATPQISFAATENSEADIWIAEAIEETLKNLRTAENISNPIRILSQALPCPSSDGQVFSEIINAFHQATPGSPTQWINVFHAVPGRFNFEDIPKSPPNTPGQPIGGDDYFTHKVFDSAVTVSDYQLDLTSLPHSPYPVVPPSSINVSVVERYIPPTSPNEFVEMFDANGHSILVDRMVELSPHNGSLVFIYPTKSGAKTFVQQYLSPILDPLLRSVVVVNGLSANLGASLGKVGCVEQLTSHSTLERRIAELCNRLSQASSMKRFHGKQAAFELVYSAKKEIALSRKIWAEDWWSKQEKVKLRAEVEKEVRNAKERPNSSYSGKPAVEMVQELLEGVASKQRYAEQPRNGVEVGVFVIKRIE